MIGLLVYVLLAAFVWAKLEIEIEGKNGWASELPTWRIQNHVLLDWFYGGRPLTGYHVWAYVFVFLTLHLPFFRSAPWSVGAELVVVAAYIVFWVIEDFLWFILNPHYGWNKFNSQHIWWHRRWWIGFPADYWVLGVISTLVFFVAHKHV